MCALELVSDRAKKSRRRAKDAVQKVYDAAYEAGVMVRTSAPNVIISPPLVVTAADVSAHSSRRSTRDLFGRERQVRRRGGARPCGSAWIGRGRLSR